MAFRVGQKVVCVDDSRDWMGRKELSIGAVYTIRGFEDEFEAAPEKPLAVLLEEITPTYDPRWSGEIGFRQNRFRPIIEKKTDAGMAILREILDRETDTTPIKKPERVR